MTFRGKPVSSRAVGPNNLDTGPVLCLGESSVNADQGDERFGADSPAREHARRTHSNYEAGLRSNRLGSSDDGALHVTGMRGIAQETPTDLARRLAKSQQDKRSTLIQQGVQRVALGAGPGLKGVSA